MGDTRRQQSYLSRNILNSELNHPHIQEDSLFQRILNSIPKYNFKNRQKGTIFIVVKQLDKHNEFVSRHVSDFGNHFRVKLKKKMKRVDSFEAHESIVTFDGPMVFQISYNAESFQQKYATVTIELCQSEASRSLNSKTFRINILTMINEYKQNFQSTINMQSIPNNWIKYQIPMNYAGILEIEFAFQEFFNQNQVARLQRLMDEQVSSSVTPRQNVFQSTGMTLYSSSQPMPLSPASSVTPLSAKVSSVPLSSEVMNEPLSSLPENEKINGKKSTTQVKNVRSKVSAIYPQDFKDSKEVEQSHDVPTPRFEIKSRHMWKFRSICFQCRHNFTCCKWR